MQLNLTERTGSLADMVQLESANTSLQNGKAIISSVNHKCRVDSISVDIYWWVWLSKEEGLRIAVDEINTFLLSHDMLIYLVVFDQKTSKLGTRLYPGLESYIDQKYVEEKRQEEYFGVYDTGNFVPSTASDTTAVLQDFSQRRRREEPCTIDAVSFEEAEDVTGDGFLDFEGLHESKLQERMRHLSDTFS